MHRRPTILSWIAALGLLLHAATAAASVWCSMAGSLATSCACAGEGAAADDRWEAPPGDCCRQAPEAQAIELAAHEAPATPILPELPWEALPLFVPTLAGVTSEAGLDEDPPTILELATIVIVR